MQVSELIAQLQSHLDQRLADVPVLVAGSESRPVPAVLIENWNATPLEGSVNDYLTSLYDESGDETARVYRLPYRLRVSFLVRENDTADASRLHDSLAHELFRIETRPERLDDKISQAQLRGGGQLSHQFINPVESELTLAQTYTTSRIYTDEEWDRIESISNDVSIVDTL